MYGSEKVKLLSYRSQIKARWNGKLGYDINHRFHWYSASKTAFQFQNTLF